MDISTIASAAISILVPYLAKTGEELVKAVGEVAHKKASDLHQAIKTRFSKEKDDYPTKTLERFEEDPETRQGAMQEVLSEILNKDEQFSQQLIELVKETSKADKGAVFNVQVFGGEVGEIINVDKLDGTFKIEKKE